MRGGPGTALTYVRGTHLRSEMAADVAAAW